MKCLEEQKFLNEFFKKIVREDRKNSIKKQNIFEKIKLKKIVEKSSSNHENDFKKINKNLNLNRNNILKYFHVIYVSKKTTLKIEILRRCHDDFLTKHFKYEKTIHFV